MVTPCAVKFVRPGMEDAGLRSDGVFYCTVGCASEGRHIPAIEEHHDDSDDVLASKERAARFRLGGGLGQTGDVDARVAWMERELQEHARAAILRFRRKHGV